MLLREEEVVPGNTQHIYLAKLPSRSKSLFGFFDFGDVERRTSNVEMSSIEKEN